MEILDLSFAKSVFVDDRNLALWNKLNSIYEIGIIDTYAHYELKYQDGSKQVIIFTDNKYNKGIFTHELLHLNLRSIGLNSLSMYASLMNYHKTYIIQALISLLNCIEHILFFDDFLDMGFTSNQFVMDYDTSSYTEANFLSVKLAKNGSDKNLYTVYFLSTQITMYSEEYSGQDRTAFLQKLKNIDPKMFSVGLKLYGEIIDFEIKESKHNDNQGRFNKMILQYLPGFDKVHESCITPPKL